jgi:hypothetical protein
VKSLTLFKRRLDPERVTGGRSFVIEATGLVRAYDQGDEKVFALRGVDLVVRQGEFLAITGPSGFREVDSAPPARRARSPGRGTGTGGGSSPLVGCPMKL